jgi:hypothetical protein
MERSIKVIGKITKCMVKECSNGLTEEYMREITLTIKSMVMVR